MFNIQVDVKDRASGEYRAVLRGPDGEIKHDSGWKPNTVLDTGIWEMLQYDYALRYMTFGTSGAATDPSQTGIQGTVIPRDGTYDYIWYESQSVLNTNAGAPDYQAQVTHEYIALEGQCTGTIAEFCLGAEGRNSHTQQAVRVALDTPIVKGPDDVLTMEYKFTLYLDLTDKTGVVNISGEDYNYVFRRVDADYSPHSFEYMMWVIHGSWSYFKALTFTGGIVPVTQNPKDTWSNLVDSFLESPNNRTGLVMGTGGSVGNYYRTLGFNCGVDDLNGTFDTVVFETGNGVGGWQVSLNKVSDGTPFTKLNTHEFGLQMRCYLEAYTP